MKYIGKGTMRHVKLFEEFIVESSRNPLVDSILSALENTILDMVDKTEKYYTEKGEKFTSFDREMTRLGIIHDLLKSLGTYTLPTDMLISINPRTSGKGNLEIYGRIQRGEESYFFETEAIVAGGHNIQRAHYRYITKTNLPKTGRTELAAEYAEKIKRMSKLEKLNQEIRNWEERIKKNEEQIQFGKSLSDEEILKKYRAGENAGRSVMAEDPSWEEIVKRGADKNFKNREEFEQKMAETRLEQIEFWKRVNIKWKEQDNVTGQKEITKLQKKIEAAIGG